MDLKARSEEELIQLFLTDVAMKRSRHWADVAMKTAIQAPLKNRFNIGQKTFGESIFLCSVNHVLKLVAC